MNETIILAWLAFIAAALSPGPNMVAVIERALGSGRGAALRLALGLGVGAFFWAILTTLGLGALFKAYPWLVIALGLVGGIYLCWLGFKGLRSAYQGGQSAHLQQSLSSNALADFLQGLMVTASNPKVAMFWVSLSTFVASGISGTTDLLVFASGAAILAFGMYGSYGLLFSIKKIRAVHQIYARGSALLFGLVFVFLGLSLIVYIYSLVT